MCTCSCVPDEVLRQCSAANPTDIYVPSVIVCLPLVRCLRSENVAIGFLCSVEPNFVEKTALGSLKQRLSYSR